MKLVVGLGNPGKEYENTRHNVGFIILDNYLGNVNWEQKDDYLFYKTKFEDEDVIFLKPLTFMNLSGIAVRKVVSYYKISLEDILVIHDDLDLPLDKYRLKFKSSSGGHNGIKSIIESLDSDAFGRLKVGIGHDRSKETKNFVLGRLSKEEKAIINNEIYSNIIEYFIINDIESTMNKFNIKG